MRGTQTVTKNLGKSTAAFLSSLKLMEAKIKVLLVTLGEHLLGAPRIFMPGICVLGASSVTEGEKALWGSRYLSPATQPWPVISAEKSIEAWPHRDGVSSVLLSLVPSNKVPCT